MPSLLLPSIDSLPPDEVFSHYQSVLARNGGPPIEVRVDAGDGKGKGVFATRGVAEGDAIWSETPLVSLQHEDNKACAQACSHCHRFIGTIECQIGHKLHCLVEQLKGAQAGGHKDGQGGAAAAAPGGDGGDSDDGEDEGEEEVDLEAALEAGERLEQIYSEVSPERIEELRGGAARLPLSERFPLPAPVRCRRACGAAYCSDTCEQAAWAEHHCLLCTGAAAAAAEDGAGPSTSSGAAGAAGGEGAQQQAEEVEGVAVDRRALAEFVAHARETNEIFILAAQVVASTLLRAVRLLRGEAVDLPSAAEGSSSAAGGSGDSGSSGTCAAAGSSGAAAGGSAAAGECGTLSPSAALRAAWAPFLFGWKRVWWEAVAVPDDVDDEDDFREQLRMLAADSLELLSAALRHADLGPQLLELQVYGSIVGMFELNNVGIELSSPVEDYFLAVDELEEGADKEAVTRETQPLLDALDSEYATPCEGTAFLALHSCVNHSCDPNAAVTWQRGDRTLTVTALRPIGAGDEVSLSYLDDTSAPYKQRQAELREYGFVCRCSRCVVEAARAKKQGPKGMKVGRRVR